MSCSLILIKRQHERCHGAGMFYSQPVAVSFSWRPQCTPHYGSQRGNVMTIGNMRNMEIRWQESSEMTYLKTKTAVISSSGECNDDEPEWISAIPPSLPPQTTLQTFLSIYIGCLNDQQFTFWHLVYTSVSIMTVNLDICKGWTMFSLCSYCVMES